MNSSLKKMKTENLLNQGFSFFKYQCRVEKFPVAKWALNACKNNMYATCVTSEFHVI